MQNLFWRRTAADKVTVLTKLYAYYGRRTKLYSACANIPLVELPGNPAQATDWLTSYADAELVFDDRVSGDAKSLILCWFSYKRAER